ncbi:PKD domain-containing protein [Candidatus Peregrinibacteria bacterium]|nr:PKD domain-containing protein [Candidatus Peregrinibacteria bacterium]
MEDNNPNRDNNDYEMGPEVDDQPKINNYMNKSPKNPQQTNQEPTTNDVNPAGPPPPETPERQQQSGQSGQQQTMQPRQQQSGQSGQQQTPPPNWMQQKAVPGKRQTIGKVVKSKPKGNPAAKRKAVMGCLGAFGFIVVVFIILSFVFIAQSGQEVSPIARLLGINQASFVNGLITFVNVLFILSALVLFLLTMFGLMKAVTAKKEEKDIKKSGIRASIIAGISLGILLIIWMFAFVYLDSKRIRGPEEVLAPIITSIEGEVSETINLTAPVTIKFDASNVPYDANTFNIISYRWDFGDGEIGTDQIVTHTYESKGEGRYDVILSVTRRNKTTGEEFVDEYSEIVTIANQALSAIFTADPQSGPAPLEVKFDASESTDPDGEIERYEWDLNEDGEFDDAEGIEAEFEFEQIGTYEVSLRVTNSTGEYAIAEKEIVVEEENLPEPVITITNEPETFVTGVQYVFKADQSTSPNGNIEEFEWDFGDGSGVVTTKTATHTFDKEGTYEVVLKVIDEEEEEGEIRKSITVGAPQGKPKAIIETEPEISGTALSGEIPFTVVFDGSSSTDSDNNIVDYEWDFDGDGEADSYGALVSYTFDEEGTYNVTLSVIDADGNIGRASTIVKAEAQGITAAVKADKIEGTAPLTATFDASGSSYPNGQITSYKWDFGDGTSPKLGSAKITHKFDTVGTYTTTVEVIGADNSSDEAEILITVREIPLTACFTSVFEEGPAPLETTFDPGCSTGTIIDYFWDFGDGSTSSQIKPKHTFDTAGTYTVKLEVSDSENTVDIAELDITVN